jgi:hypothetical protein
LIKKTRRTLSFDLTAERILAALICSGGSDSNDASFVRRLCTFGLFMPVSTLSSVSHHGHRNVARCRYRHLAQDAVPRPRTTSTSPSAEEISGETTLFRRPATWFANNSVGTSTMAAAAQPLTTAASAVQVSAGIRDQIGAIAPM